MFRSSCPGIVDTEFHLVAKTPMPTKAGTRVGATTVLSAEEVATRIAGLIESPVAGLCVPASGTELVKQYYQDVGAFEERMARW